MPFFKGVGDEAKRCERDRNRSDPVEWHPNLVNLKGHFHGRCLDLDGSPEIIKIQGYENE